jgi:hypothetical protein
MLILVDGRLSTHTRPTRGSKADLRLGHGAYQQQAPPERGLCLR